MIRLSQIRTGDRVEVMDIPENCSLRHSLQQYGVVRGSQLFCRYCSPGGELVALECQGSVIALRLDSLTEIKVRYCL